MIEEEEQQQIISLEINILSGCIRIDVQRKPQPYVLSTPLLDFPRIHKQGISHNKYGRRRYN